MVPLINVSLKFFLLLFFVTAYIVKIVKSFMKLNEILKCLKCLLRYINSARIDRISLQFDKKENYQQCLNETLLKFPTIQKYYGGYGDSLEYGASDVENYRAAINICNYLLMKRNYLLQDFKSSFNPVRTLKTLFSFPSNLIELIGFNPSAVASRVINLGGWLLSLAISLYSTEIKVLISALIQKLMN